MVPQDERETINQHFSVLPVFGEFGQPVDLQLQIALFVDAEAVRDFAGKRLQALNCRAPRAERIRAALEVGRVHD